MNTCVGRMFMNGRIIVSLLTEKLMMCDLVIGITCRLCKHKNDIKEKQEYEVNKCHKNNKYSVHLLIHLLMGVIDRLWTQVLLDELQRQYTTHLVDLEAY